MVKGLRPSQETRVHEDLSPEHKQAFAEGMKDGFAKVDALLATAFKSVDGWSIGSLFGDRAFFNGNSLLRAAGGKGGIYGNEAVEATYPYTRKDAMGEPSTAADGPIYLVMRLHWPKDTPPSILPPGEGTWQPPGVKHVP